MQFFSSPPFFFIPVEGDGKKDIPVYRANNPPSGGPPYGIGWGCDPSHVAIGVK
jgi:hypothetical protein